MRKWIIMGVQGCGKGTQAKLICDKYHCTHISVGDIFREHIKDLTPLGVKVKSIMDSGKLVGDDVVIEVLSERLHRGDLAQGYLLDGFPRNAFQAQWLLENQKPTAVFYLDAPDQVVMERALARRVCQGCKKDYNVKSNPPKVEGLCDACGGKVMARGDDTEEALKVRLAEYHDKTEPVVKIFRDAGILKTVNAVQSVEQVFRDLESLI